MKRFFSLSIATVIALVCAISFLKWIESTKTQIALPVNLPSVKFTAAAQSCLSGGDQTVIQQRLNQTGKANLCPYANFYLTGPIILSANQEIYTEGLPTDSSRAIVRVAADSYSSTPNNCIGTNGWIKFNTVICGRALNTKVHHLIVDGGRPGYGADANGGALIEMGGNIPLNASGQPVATSIGQEIYYVKAYDPRGWSVLHIFHAGNCKGASVHHNEIGPAGHNTGVYGDGISLSCAESNVSYNQITDATDGGIVVFGAPGSVIQGNTITAQNRSAFGGINLVDQGDYTNTQVIGNTINAAGAQIKAGIPIGNRFGFCLTNNISGGLVTGNTLTGPYMGYGIPVSGVTNFNVTNNTSTAIHDGLPTIPCVTGQSLDIPKAFQRNPTWSSGTFQSQFELANLTTQSVSLEPRPTWSSWGRVPGYGATLSTPAAATNVSGTTYLAVRGTDEYIYYTQPNFQTYASSWYLLPTTTALGQVAKTDSQPALVFDAAGVLRAYIRLTADNKIYRSKMQGGTWSAWAEVPGGGTTPSGPDAVLFNGQVNVLVRGGDNQIYYKIDEVGVTSGWDNVGANYSDAQMTTPSSPSAAVEGNKLYISVHGFNYGIYFKTITGSWSNRSLWTNIVGGTTLSYPVAVINPNGTLAVYARGTDNQIHFNTMSNQAAWLGWEQLNPTMEIYGAPEVAKQNGNLRLFVKVGEGPGLMMSRSK
jgi:parallel beta-helix repeat protein